MGIEDEALAFSFDAEILNKARMWEKDEMEKIRASNGGDSNGNASKLQANTKAIFDEWIASLPEGHELKVKYKGMAG